MGATIVNQGPVADINTTPLIDVMLVLLIMFIITIPMQTHAVKVDTPAPGNPPPADIRALRNELSVDRAGTILWNDKAVSLVVLRQYLEASQRMASIPELHVRPRPDARHEVVDQVLAVAKRARM
jgi:biopolymer transport protein ExbD